MPAHESKACPRCHQQFECKVGSITICQCAALSLPPEARAELLKFDDYLCRQCLLDLGAKDEIQA